MLNLRNLRVTIDDYEIINIDELTLQPGARLGLVGESGSGKTMTAKAIAGLLPNEAKVSGEVNFDGQNLLTLGDRELANVRGKRIGFVFQDPARSLNPMMRIGKQVSEAIRIHTDLKGKSVTDKVIDLLRQVQLPEPETLLRRYPHQLSGGHLRWQHRRGWRYRQHHQSTTAPLHRRTLGSQPRHAQGRQLLGLHRSTFADHHRFGSGGRQVPEWLSIP